MVHTDEESGAETRYVKLTTGTKVKPRSFASVANNHSRPVLFWAKSARKFYAVAEGPNETHASGAVTEQYRLIDPTDTQMIERDKLDGPNAHKSWTRVTGRTEAEQLWQEQIAKLPEFAERDVHLITGVVLPIWDRLGGHPRVVRLQTDGGERLLGRVIPHDALAGTLRALGATASLPTLTPAQAIDRILNQGETATLANGWTIGVRTVAGEERIEVRGVQSFGEGEQMIADGVFAERINYERRYFIPTGAEGPAVLQRITQYRPITEMTPAARGSTTARYSKFGVTPKDPTKTLEFKKWFGDSVVVERGKPKVVYHGTPRSFEVFDTEGMAFFTDNPEYARLYAGDTEYAEEQGLGEGFAPNIIPAYLSMQNPYVMSLREFEETIPNATPEYVAATREDLEQNGHDGIIVKRFNELGMTSTIYAVFRPEQAKSTLNGGDWNAEDARMSYSKFGAETQNRPFFSALTRGIEGVSQPKAAAQQWLGILKGLQGKGVKAEEIAWSGVEDWLREQKGPVTREALLDYLRAQVEEVTKGAPADPAAHDKAVAARADELMQARADELMEQGGEYVGQPDFTAEYDEEGEVWHPVVEGETDTWDTYDTEDEALAAAEKEADQRYERAMEGARTDVRNQLDYDDFVEQAREELGEGTEPKHASYQLPGGDNYRELLLTLPVKRVVTPAQPYQQWLQEQPWSGKLQDDERARQLYDQYVERNAQGKDAPAFRAGHYDEPNVLAHVRFNERTDADGRLVLFIEEIQSDWHQKGRKKGYLREGDATIGGKSALEWDREATRLFGDAARRDRAAPTLGAFIADASASTEAVPEVSATAAGGGSGGSPTSPRSTVRRRPGMVVGPIDALLGQSPAPGLDPGAEGQEPETAEIPPRKGSITAAEGASVTTADASDGADAAQRAVLQSLLAPSDFVPPTIRAVFAERDEEDIAALLLLAA